MVQRMVLLVAAAVGAASAQLEPNPPRWPSTVRVFSPTGSFQNIEASIVAAYADNGGRKPAPARSSLGQCSAGMPRTIF